MRPAGLRGALERVRAAIPPEHAAQGAWALIGAAVALRVSIFLLGRSLWLDEAMLSLNIAGRSFRQLLGPLSYRQAAPIPFLWGMRIVTRLVGVNERALRVIPLACGIGVLVGMWLVGRRVFGARVALVAVALAAASHPLARYSLEAKQYGPDVAVTLVLVAVAAAVLRHPDSVEGWRRLAAGGAIAIGCSYTAPFLLAGIAAVIPADSRVRSSSGWLRRWLATLAAWGMTSVVVYVVLYRATAHDPELLRVWGSTFLTLGAPDFGDRLAAAVRAALTAATEPLPRWVPLWALAALFAGGLVAARRRGWSMVALLVVPYLAVAVVAALGRYPIAPRFLLFAAPLALFAYAAACVALVDAIPPARRRYALAAAVTGLLVVLGRWVPGWIGEAEIEDARSVIDKLERLRGSEPVYVMRHAIPEWAFYTTDWRRPDLARLRRLADIYTFGAAVGGVRATPGHAGGELVSSKLGVRWTAGSGWGGSRADTAWLNGDARRIREAAVPGVWLFVTQFEPNDAPEALIRALGASGGRVVCALGAKRAGALYVRFDGGAPNGQDHPQARGGGPPARRPLSGGTMPLVDANPPCEGAG